MPLRSCAAVACVLCSWGWRRALVSMWEMWPMRGIGSSRQRQYSPPPSSPPLVADTAGSGWRAALWRCDRAAHSPTRGRGPPRSGHSCGFRVFHRAGWASLHRDRAHIHTLRAGLPRPQQAALIAAVKKSSGMDVRVCNVLGLLGCPYSGSPCVPSCASATPAYWTR